MAKVNPSPECDISQLPTEIQCEILNYLDDTLDGANFILTCKDLFRNLYSSHDLFISSRLLRDLGKLVNQVEFPKFKRERKEGQKRSQKNDPMSTFEKKLSETVQDVLHIAKKAENKLESKQKMKEKVKEWNMYLDTVEKEYNKDVAQSLEDMIFSKCVIKSHNVERMDYRYTFNAKIEIGDVIVKHYAYDEEGCVTNWTLNVYKSGKSSPLRFAELEDDPVLLSNCDKVKQYLGLKENISNKLLLDTLIMALPWSPQQNCVYYGEISELNL